MRTLRIDTFTPYEETQTRTSTHSNSSSPTVEITNLCIRYKCEICGEDDHVYRDRAELYAIPSLCPTCRKRLKKLMGIFKLDD